MEKQSEFSEYDTERSASHHRKPEGKKKERGKEKNGLTIEK